MSDVSGDDVISAKTRWRSGQLAIVVLIGISSPAAIADTHSTDAKHVSMVVDAAAARYVRETPHSAAIAIGVVCGEASYQSRYGTLEPGKRRPPRPDTLYPVASITKTFTGTLLAQAVIEKRLSLSDDVRKHLDGDFPNLEFAVVRSLFPTCWTTGPVSPSFFPTSPNSNPTFREIRDRTPRA